MNQTSPRRATLAASISLILASGIGHAATFNVTTTDDAGAGSLRDAITQANGATGPHVIDMSGISGSSITLASDLPDISEEVEVLGSDATVDGNGANSCFYSYQSNLTINDLTVTNCTGHPYGGYTFGGGIEVFGADLTLNNSTVTGNTATYGGGVYVSGNAVINDSVISGNTSDTAVGGIASSDSLTLSGSVITGNTTGGEGGGFRCSSTYGCALTITESEISGNAANGGSGGGGYVTFKYDDQAMSIESSTISGNTSSAPGGGFYVRSKYESTSSTITNSTITSNSAPAGGGVYVFNEYYYYDGAPQGDSAFTFTGATISGNTASAGAGGGILAANPSASYGFDLAINTENSIVSGNSATEGSGDLELADSAGGTGPQSQADALDKAQRFINSHRGISPAMQARILERVEALFPRTRGTVGATFNATFSLIGEAPTDPSVTFNPDTATSGVLGQAAGLGALANNGGFTETLLPGAGSPAIDLVPSASGGCGTTFVIDQRGEPRPFGGGCDAGSVEVGEGGAVLPESVPVPTMSRIGLGILALGMGLLGLLGWQRRRGDPGMR